MMGGYLNSMVRMTARIASRALLLVLLPVSASGSENIAIGAAVRFSEPPRYDLTVDPQDATQLTDGRKVDGTMWTSREAVGWLTGSAPVRIDIDLGREHIVGDVCLHTARRAEAGVEYPVRVDVFTATEPSRFAWGGRMTPLADGGSGEYQAREFCLAGIDLPARIVSLQVAVIQNHFFTDEISITAGVARDTARALISEAERRAFAVLHETVVRSLAEVARQVPANSELAARLERLAESVDGSPGTLDLDVLNERDRELRDIVGALREQRGEGLTAVFSDPWPAATPFEGHALQGELVPLEIAASQHGAAAVAIAHDRTGDIDVSVEAKVIGEGSDGVKLGLSEVCFVVRADGVMLGDALRPLSGNRLPVRMGETRQVWIDIAPEAVDRERHLTLQLTVRTSDGAERTLNRPLLIYPLPAITKPPFTVVWGYLDQLPIRAKPRQASLDMQAHGVTTAVLPAGDLPWPGQESAGLATIGQYRHYDNVMRHLEGHKEYLFFLSLNEDSGYRQRLGDDFLSARWQQVFTSWTAEWVARLSREGIEPARIAFYPVDEPDSPADLDTLVEISRLIKSIDPALRIYTTFHDPDSLTDAVIEAVDVFQLNGLALNADVIERLKARGKVVASYATSGGGKAGAPGAFYRALGWKAFVAGLDGFGFWSYADTGVSGSAWNDIDDVQPDFAVVYEGERDIVSSKRWEAWREGVQDYQLLAAARASASGEAAIAEILAIGRAAEASGYETGALSTLRSRLRRIASGTGNPQQ